MAGRSVVGLFSAKSEIQTPKKNQKNNNKNISVMSASL
jgi:flagellar basal body rod protein FlgF